MARVLLFLAAVGGLALVLASLFPHALRSEGERMALVYYLAWITVIGSGILITFRQRWSDTVKHGLVWLLVLLAAVAAYSFREEAHDVALRVVGELFPFLAISTGPGEVALRPGIDGHFYAGAEINGADVLLMVDTGASMIALTPEDAYQAGFEPRQLSYAHPVMTANGTTLTALVRLDEVQIGSIVMQDVAGAVMRPGQLSHSLLGMSFLGRLDGLDFRRDRLILRE